MIALDACPVLVPQLVALLPPLGALLARLDLARPGGELEATASASGIDLQIIAAHPPSLADREALAAFAAAHDLARITWCPDATTPAEPIVQRRAPKVAFGQVQVELPPGAFLQASEAAEAAIRRAVDEAIGDARRIADLFAGCGTLSLPLAAAGRTVHALERDPAMLAALEQAARRAGLAARVTTERRDLQRAPLAGAELARFDALVVDPPRAGARAQAAALAASRSGAPRAGLVQPGDLRARCPDPRRRRLALPLGPADRRLSVVEPDRAGGRVRPPATDDRRSAPAHAGRPCESQARPGRRAGTRLLSYH